MAIIDEATNLHHTWLTFQRKPLDITKKVNRLLLLAVPGFSEMGFDKWKDLVGDAETRRNAKLQKYL